MQRGDLSNRSIGICAIDYRVVLATQRTQSKLVRNLSQLILHKSFEKTARSLLPWKKHACLWLERNSNLRQAIFSIAVPQLSRAIDMVVGDHIAETYHFKDIHEFREWVRITGQLSKVITADPTLWGMADIVVPHQGWAKV